MRSNKYIFVIFILKMPKKYKIKNRAAFAFLTTLTKKLEKIIKLNPSFTNEKLGFKKEDVSSYQEIIALLKDFNGKSQYDDDYDYHNIYSSIQNLAEQIESIPYNFKIKPEDQRDQRDQSALDFHENFFLNLFDNDNKIHDEIYKKLIKPTIKQLKSHEKPRHKLEQKIKNGSDTIKSRFWKIHNPVNDLNRLVSLLGGSKLLGIKYNPLTDSNIPYLPFKTKEGEPVNVRYGSQINGFKNVNQSFKQHLRVKQERKLRALPKEQQAIQPSEKQYHHVYFNRQGREYKTDGLFVQRYAEMHRSRQLEKLEQETPSLGIAVVTFPADNEFYLGKFNKDKGIDTYDDSKTETTEFFLQQLQESIDKNKNDFYISDDVKKQILGDGSRMQKQKINNLFKKAVIDICGFYKNELPPDERQAVFFHFVNYHLTQAVLDAITPDSYNISCKDAIDRGGVGNLWHHMEKRLKEGKPISKEEFEKHLDASPILVRGRPINDHKNLIWNALKVRYLCNSKLAKQMPWIKDWLLQNYPGKIYNKVSFFKRIVTSTSRKKHELFRKKHELFSAFENRINVREQSLKKDLPSKLNQRPAQQKEPPQQPMTVKYTTLPAREESLEKDPRSNLNQRAAQPQPPQQPVAVSPAIPELLGTARIDELKKQIISAFKEQPQKHKVKGADEMGETILNAILNGESVINAVTRKGVHVFNVQHILDHIVDLPNQKKTSVRDMITELHELVQDKLSRDKPKRSKSHSSN